MWQEGVENLPLTWLNSNVCGLRGAKDWCRLSRKRGLWRGMAMFYIIYSWH